MIEIFVTEEFEMQYKKLTSAIQKKAEKQEKLFKENPFYPSLHTEKLEPNLMKCGVFVLIKTIESSFVLLV